MRSTLGFRVENRSWKISSQGMYGCLANKLSVPHRNNFKLIGKESQPVGQFKLRNLAPHFELVLK